MPAIRPAFQEVNVSVDHIREAFGWLRSQGLVSDTQVLRQCSRAYERNSKTRNMLQKRLELHAALRKVSQGELLTVTDDLGRSYQVEPTGKALAALTRQLKRARPEAFLSICQDQPPSMFLPLEQKGAA